LLNPKTPEPQNLYLSKPVEKLILEENQWKNLQELAAKLRDEIKGKDN
jgi:hypothetical protein